MERDEAGWPGGIGRYEAKVRCMRPALGDEARVEEAKMPEEMRLGGLPYVLIYLPTHIITWRPCGTDGCPVFTIRTHMVSFRNILSLSSFEISYFLPYQIIIMKE